ncbi:MAG: NADH:ubiquinone reductase (Na(+)-transporting) subunit C [Planctomycetota bacterium]
MNTSSNNYVLGFAVVICVAMSATLAVIATALKPTQQAAAEFDRQKNVMMAAGLVQEGGTRSRKELEQLYQERVEERVIDVTTGQPAADLTPQAVAAMKSDADRARYRVVATTKGDDGKLGAIVLPISGKGLWSTLYGYLALEGDGNTVRGITFYKHGETPGLGGEVENPAWTGLWPGKTILDQGKLVSITVKKGVVNPAVPNEKQHYVDGLSGATITSNGVTKFVRSDLEAFRPYLQQFWSK